MTTWIKWTKGLSRRREVIAIARALAVSPREGAAICMEFWEWADDETSDGSLPDISAADVDAIVGADGLCAALEAVGWLQTRHSGLRIPDWSRHNGASAKRRGQDARRKMSARTADTERTPVRTMSSDKADKCPQATRTDVRETPDKKRTREEKIREEQAGTNAKPETSGIPGGGARSPEAESEGFAGGPACPEAERELPEGLDAECLLKGLGVRDPVRGRLIEAGVTGDEIRKSWLTISGHPRDPVAVLAARLCEAHGVNLRGRCTVKDDWANRVRKLRAHQRGVA